jgi:hypothetical protein
MGEQSEGSRHEKFPHSKLPTSPAGKKYRLSVQAGVKGLSDITSAGTRSARLRQIRLRRPSWANRNARGSEQTSKMWTETDE